MNAPAKRGPKFAFETPEQLGKAIEKYFDYCDNRTKTIYNEKTGELIISDPAPYTMSGLARSLGVDRDTVINYAKRDKYSALIREARAKVHEDVETRLMDTKNERGAIFNLKNNFGWKDKSETEHSGGIQISFHQSLKQIQDKNGE